MGILDLMEGDDEIPQPGRGNVGSHLLIAIGGLIEKVKTVCIQIDNFCVTTKL